MRRVSLFLILALTVSTVACTPIEKQAYNTIVAAKAFLDASKAQHKECSAEPTKAVCVDLQKATAAKDFLIDSVEVYCSSPSFDTAGGTCMPPAKGTPAYQVAITKLQAAIAAYNQAAADLKGVL